ncbi:MAG TPA: hypothetical protein VMY42_14105 [Thermoguttaceae bacterium]|nr:hypothetical protein [Thermoguttaceae bacterium]
MNESAEIDEFPLCCERCGVELTPGRGGFYLVRIEALADPTPPSFSLKDLTGNTQAEIRELLRQMEDLSAQEAMDQVYRRLVLYLCGPCYREWIEKPTG